MKFAYVVIAAAFVPAAALLPSTIWAADDDVMAGLYGNTFYVTDASGTMKYHYAADHTYNAVLPDGKAVKGTWALKDNRLCETANSGPESDKENCNPIRAHKAGDSWTGGGGKTLKIEAGLQ